VGQAQSLNRVIHNLKSEYVCWLSDDNIVVEGMLDKAMHILDADPDIGLLVLKTTDITGHNAHLPYIGGIRPSLILNCNQGMLKTRLFNSLGGFDENFRDYGIDSDLTAKVLLSGKRVVYTKQIAIHHYRDHETDNWIESKERKARKFNGRKLYNAKYADLIDWVQRDNGSAVAIEQKLYARISGFYAFSRRFRIPVEKITGYNERDWYNVLKCRFISNWDLIINIFRKYYLVQYIPLEIRSKILSDKMLSNQIMPGKILSGV
jgi:GT2 family glycosyltransferase